MPSIASDDRDAKIAGLVDTAKKLISTDLSVGKGKSSKEGVYLENVENFWKAYVALEYAILHLKLVKKLDGKTNADTRPVRKRLKTKGVTENDILAIAREKLASLENSMMANQDELLLRLRECRDILKALVAAYDTRRRSTTS